MSGPWSRPCKFQLSPKVEATVEGNGVEGRDLSKKHKMESEENNVTLVISAIAVR